jgi:hypothetical protein
MVREEARTYEERRRALGTRDELQLVDPDQRDAELEG